MFLKELNKQGKNFLTSTIDFFLPRFCPACKRKLTESENIVCQECLNKIQRPSIERLNAEFSRKFARENIISDFYSLFIFEKEKEFQSIAHELKYNGKLNAGIFLGKLIAKELESEICKWDADFIIPIPLHSLKKAERGFNQSYFIAKGIKSILGIPIDQKIIKRSRFTESQTTMTLLERKENIQNAFTTKSTKRISGKKIILLDDVITTGATISECGRMLLEANAEKIFALSAAIAD